MSYKSIIESRGLSELPYQKEFLTNSKYKNCTKPLVLAAGTSSGKTFMSIMDLELFYSNSENKNKRTLYLPASKTILRDNIAGEIKWFNPSFTYCVATNKKELLQAIKNKCQVIIALPQTINSNYHYLPKFHNFILDEAHQWYFKDTVQKIVKQIKPTRQLLLTGTPSRFIAKGEQFQFKFVPVMELFDLKQVTNVKLEVVSSSYDFKQSDYVSSYGNLKSNVKMSDKESETALMGVCKEMIKKLKNPIKGLHNVNRLSKNLFSIFGELDKTIIFCHSKKQADAFYESLNGFKGLTGKVLVSHSENDKDSESFIEFKDNSDIKVLVAVDRGRLGYNMPELFNVVDFTLTQSLDMLLQMYGRLLRLSKTDKQKTYYKVATKNTAPYFVDLMTAMLCLTNMEWYSKYNGKNMGGILIPRVLSNTKGKLKSNITTKGKSKTTKPVVSLEQLGIPLDLNLFNQSVLHTNGDEFATIAWNTLDEVRREFFNIIKPGTNQHNSTFLSYDEAKKFVHTLNLKLASDWGRYIKGEFQHLPKKPNDIPNKPMSVYRKQNTWISSDDFFNLNIPQHKIGYTTYDEAKKFVHTLNLKSWNEWLKYVKGEFVNLPKKPNDIPNRPHGLIGFISTGDWIGTGTIAYKKRKYKTYKEAKKFVHSLKLKTKAQWWVYCKNEFKNLPQKPNDIPMGAAGVYKNNWKGWGDFLGNGK